MFLVFCCNQDVYISLAGTCMLFFKVNPLQRKFISAQSFVLPSIGHRLLAFWCNQHIFFTWYVYSLLVNSVKYKGFDNFLWSARTFLFLISVLICLNYRPQLRCGKVMFSQACVKNSVRGGVSQHALGQTPSWADPLQRTVRYHWNAFLFETWYRLLFKVLHSG